MWVVGLSFSSSVANDQAMQQAILKGTKKRGQIAHFCRPTPTHIAHIAHIDCAVRYWAYACDGRGRTAIAGRRLGRGGRWRCVRCHSTRMRCICLFGWLFRGLRMLRWNRSTKDRTCATRRPWALKGRQTWPSSCAGYRPLPW